MIVFLATLKKCTLQKPPNYTTYDCAVCRCPFQTHMPMSMSYVVITSKLKRVGQKPLDQLTWNDPSLFLFTTDVLLLNVSQLTEIIFKYYTYWLIVILGAILCKKKRILYKINHYTGWWFSITSVKADGIMACLLHFLCCNKLYFFFYLYYVSILILY